MATGVAAFLDAHQITAMDTAVYHAIKPAVFIPYQDNRSVANLYRFVIARPWLLVFETQEVPRRPAKYTRLLVIVDGRIHINPVGYATDPLVWPREWLAE